MQKTLQKNKVIEFSNVALVTELEGLERIHESKTNIAIYERNVKAMEAEIDHLLATNLLLKLSGTSKEIIEQLSDAFNANHCNAPMLLNDAKQLLKAFEIISEAKSFRLNLFTVNSNMCRRFHTDINDLRLLCTYSGPGTFWLPEEAANRNQYHTGGDNEEIVANPKLIQQANAGDVVILKGALYPNADAAIHRSPSIEESGEKRLLLRIDTNEFANFG